ncbi:TIM-barrel domain-containing protein [Sphingomonas sp.]|uniref:glycoside hydrolase family 31 protein n=1 Tax=Sphingomonas sp. TaxID=28214 RepID=UPI003B3A586C
MKAIGATWAAILLGGSALAAPLASVDRHGSVVAIEPYAPNVVRVTIALDHTLSDAAPGYGVVAKANASGWTRSTNGDGGDRLASGSMQVTVEPQPWPAAPTQMARYCASALPPVAISIADGAGKPIVRMKGWEMAPHTVNDEKTFRIGATFTVTPNEHFYGLGQNQEGKLDLRGRTIDCRHYYDAPAGETVCVPVLVSSNNYMIVWDNPSVTTVSPGLHNSTHFQSEVGERVSFFVVTGNNSDELYKGYRLLTGVTPLPPKAAFGLIQSKARYERQAELMAVAEGYRSRQYPLDIMVLDWFHWTRMGQMDIDRTFFPDPAGMNRQLHDWGMKSIISVWPRYEREGRYFDMLASKGWLLKDKDGNPVDGLPVRYDRAGALLDSTNPEAREWFWGKIRDNILAQGFDYTWLDETEPDLIPDGYQFSIGSGDRYHNLFPLVHTMGVADGSARDRPDFRNLILARAAYLGTQASGAIFWTSDVFSTWEALRRQVPANLNMAASGIAYTSSDTGGWQVPSGPAAQHPPLIDPAGAVSTGRNYPDYPELFVRWFQLNSFTPTLRIHGDRPGGSAIWEYGTAAEPILADWLRLRYQLMPYLYAMGRQTYETGAPFMRALFMDFPNDPAVAAIGDQYMFGPAFLVAPVTDQGATSRRVYLPAGSDWYDWWTDKRFTGGQWIDAAAPIERMPLFVRAGSIVPLGTPVQNTTQKQSLSEIRVYPGRSTTFALYDDDGVTNAYKNGTGKSATLRWDDGAGRLSASGTLPTGQAPAALVKIVRGQ